jgi:hypothetical protein
MATSSFFTNQPWRSKNMASIREKCNAMQPLENLYSIAAAASGQAEEDSLLADMPAFSPTT